jgi:phage tail-like protein
MPAPTLPPTAPAAARNGAGAGAATPAAAPSRRSPAKTGVEPDPVTELRFIVELPGVVIGRFKEVSGLSAQVDVKEYAEGGVNHFMHKLPGRIKWGPLTLKRGVTHHDALIGWFWEARTRTRPLAMVVSLRGPGGEEVRSWAFVDAFPVKWTGPNLNASSSQIATESLEIAHSGLTRAS